jgi:hypothetical protein
MALRHFRWVGLFVIILGVIFGVGRATAHAEGATVPTTAPNQSDVVSARPAFPRMSSELARLVKTNVDLAANRVGATATASDAIEIIAVPSQGQSVSLLAEIIRNQGGTVYAEYQDSVYAAVQAQGLVQLSQRSEVRVMETPEQPAPTFVYPRTGSGATISEGVAALNATNWQSTGWQGSGINIVVLDTAFSGFPALQDNYAGTGDYSCVKGSKYYPPYNSILKDQTVNTITRGSQVLQIICDVAPGASVYAVRVSNLNSLQQVSMDMKAYFESYGKKLNMIVSAMTASRPQGPGDASNTTIGTPTGTPNPVDLIVRDGSNAAIAWAQSNGILWVNTAGNYRTSHWSGIDLLPDSKQENIPFDSNPNHTTNQFTWKAANGPVAITLRWSGNWASSLDKDYDLFVSCQAGGGPTYFVSSGNDQNGTKGIAYPYPREYLIFPDPNAPNPPITDQLCSIRILRNSIVSGTPKNYLDLFVLQRDAVLTYNVQSSSIPSEENALLSVGAFCFDRGAPTNVTPWAVSTYSSYGPINNFNAIGTPNPVPAVVKPDVVGPSSVSYYYGPNLTATPGGNTSCPVGFADSEAGTAHVAGAAALFGARTSVRDTAPVQWK